MADALLCAGERASLEPIGFVDDGIEAGVLVLGLPVFGPLASLPSLAHDAVVVAIGDNGRRREVCVQLEESGQRLVAAVHPSAIIARDVVIEPGAMICAAAVVNTGSRVGKGAIINTGATVDHHSTIGACAHIAPGVRMGGEVHIGPGSLVGVGAVILPRRIVGRGAIVGAGAVVTRDVADGTCVVGAPARPMIRKLQ